MRPSCQTRSKAWLTFRNTARQNYSILAITRWTCSTVECFLRNSRSRKNFFFSITRTSPQRKSFSNNFDITGKREIGLYKVNKSLVSLVWIQRLPTLAVFPRKLCYMFAVASSTLGVFFGLSRYNFLATSQMVFPMKTALGLWAISDQENADLFANQFANSFTPFDIDTDIIPDISIAKGNPIRFTSSRKVDSLMLTRVYCQRE